MEENNQVPKTELVFCQLCGKHKPPEEFINFNLGQIGNIVIQCAGCHACSVVIHNALRIVKEVVQKINQEKSKIIQPSFIPPRDLKTN